MGNTLLTLIYLSSLVILKFPSSSIASFIPIPTKTSSGKTNQNKEYQVKSGLWGMLSSSISSTLSKVEDHKIFENGIEQKNDLEILFIHENLSGIDVIKCME